MSTDAERIARLEGRIDTQAELRKQSEIFAQRQFESLEQSIKKTNDAVSALASNTSSLLALKASVETVKEIQESVEVIANSQDALKMWQVRVNTGVLILALFAQPFISWLWSKIVQPQISAVPAITAPQSHPDKGDGTK